MTRSAVNSLLDRVERRAEGVAWVESLVCFVEAATEDRVLQLSLLVTGTSLWCTLALGEWRFLLLSPAALIAARRFRQLEQETAEDEDWQ
jgi:hypothetical protein